MAHLSHRVPLLAPCFKIVSETCENAADVIAKRNVDATNTVKTCES